MKKEEHTHITVHLADCTENPGHVHVSDITAETVEAYVPDGPASGTSVGYSRGYAANWDAVFGEDKKPEPELN